MNSYMLELFEGGTLLVKVDEIRTLSPVGCDTRITLKDSKEYVVKGRWHIYVDSVGSGNLREYKEESEKKVDTETIKEVPKPKANLIHKEEPQSSNSYIWIGLILLIILILLWYLTK